jgi:hypothetical protein
MLIDVVVRSHEAGKGARDAIRVAVSAKPVADLAGKGSVRFGAGEHGVEILLKFAGRRGPAADRADVSIEGEYEVFFGAAGQGIEVTGAFKGDADLAPGEERVLSEVEVAGERNEPAHRIQIVVRARR